MDKRLCYLIAKVMDVPAEQINEKSGPDNIENWDSFNGLLLVDELESEFNVKFSLEDISDVKTAHDIMLHLKAHGVVLND